MSELDSVTGLAETESERERGGGGGETEGEREGQRETLREVVVIICFLDTLFRITVRCVILPSGGRK